ncbi:MAG: hypothetical protein EXQ56_04790 [Acidobacteria bacterium]|nr:hypothetical protein [Acidobacteriota bacterium]
MRQLTSSVLLLLLISDLGLHFGESYFAIPEDDLQAATQLVGGLAAPHASESGCPIPGHSNDPFHHHHFPGVVVSEGYLAPSEMRSHMLSSLTELSGSSMSIMHPGRAPSLES